MKALRVFASALALLCLLDAVGFPSVSPFWTVPNLASLNNFGFDYPLDRPSVEWLILGAVVNADMVTRVSRRDAAFSERGAGALRVFTKRS